MLRVGGGGIRRPGAGEGPTRLTEYAETGRATALMNRSRVQNSERKRHARGQHSCAGEDEDVKRRGPAEQLLEEALWFDRHKKEKNQTRTSAHPGALTVSKDDRMPWGC